ncbi:MAG: AGE family epimerase/isomerase [Spirochaetia bacterium]|jgi:N-acylglucosamine 2-epimerase
MTGRRINELSAAFRAALLDDTIPFWLSHATDREFGGYTTFLDRTGKLLCPDKPMWVQGRMGWTMARLYNDLEKRDEWLAASRHAVDFIRAHGFDTDGRIFYAVTRDGRPLRKRRYLFAEIFAVMAFAEYGKAAGDRESVETAKRLMRFVQELHARPWTEPGALEPKVMPQTRPMRGHSMAMIQINTLQILRGADTTPDPLPYDALIDAQIDEVFRFFVKPEKKALLETVGPNGEYLGETPEGRCVNPGHAMETAWFIMAEGKRRKDNALIERVLPILDWSLESGWDPKYGGILYFIDVEGRQPVQYEWDMKLWWPHNEAINATLLAHSLTGEKRYEAWFEKILKWSLARFADKKHGEWFGYLHRDGSLSHDLKGNMWKGPFHLPRQQLFCHLLLEEMKGRK